jgi:heme-degrading monooxygenase HmoA
MIARATMAEIDTLRIRVDEATTIFRESVLPELRDQEGYEGAYVLLSPEGKALVITFWATEEAAEAGLRGARSFYVEQVEKFVTFFRAPPGRETYEVLVADSPGVTTV